MPEEEPGAQTVSKDDRENHLMHAATRLSSLPAQSTQSVLQIAAE
jgi:hypothetical protein